MTQKFFDRLLFIIFIICLFIIFQIKFIHFQFNLFNISQSNIDKTNDIIFNLAIGIIASYIFYVINIQIATYIRKKKTLNLIDSYLIDIATQMKVGQLYLSNTYFLNRDFDVLSATDFNRFTTLSNTQINFRYRQTNIS